MSPTSNDWASWSKHVLFELERAEKERLAIKECKAKLKEDSGELKHKIADLEKEYAEHKAENKQFKNRMLGLGISILLLLVGLLLQQHFGG